jgi:hypothetical protein
MGADLMRRREDWLPRLAVVLERAAAKPFVWGSHDCWTFAADCIEAVTGERPAPAWLGRYTSHAGALRHVRKAGFADMAAAFDATIGPRGPIGLAARGDIVLVAIDGAEGFGVVDTSGEAVFCVGLEGLVIRPLSDVVARWSIA